MSEQSIRLKLAEIDRLRARSATCSEMHTHWMGSDSELVEIQSVIVRRRWRKSKTIHSELVMTVAEREMFRDWLISRRVWLEAQIEALTGELGNEDEVASLTRLRLSCL